MRPNDREEHSGTSRRQGDGSLIMSPLGIVIENKV